MSGMVDVDSGDVHVSTVCILLCPRLNLLSFVDDDEEDDDELDVPSFVVVFVVVCVVEDEDDPCCVCVYACCLGGTPLSLSIV